MKTFRNICAAALVAVPFASLAIATAEASPRGYNNHGGYTSGHNRTISGRAHFVRRPAWQGRMHVSRRFSWRRRGH